MHHTQSNKQQPENPHAPLQRSSIFRFYGPLNDFLSAEQRQRNIVFRFSGFPSIRDSIQAQGIPHTEVELILVNSHSQPFEHHLCGGERVSVYPRFRTLDTSAVSQVSTAALRIPRFILDVHLGKLCRHLRLLGFDTRYGNDFEDSYIIDCALREQRTILTRDLGILKQSRVTHGYFVRATDPNQQIEEVLMALDLTTSCKPLTRCINCNGTLQRVSKSQVEDAIPEGTKRCYDVFYQCLDCHQIYWRGAHYIGLMGKLAQHNHLYR